MERKTSMSCAIFSFLRSRRRHTRCLSDWSSDVCSSDLFFTTLALLPVRPGDVPKLRVQDLDTNNRMLRIPVGKDKPPREIPLPDEAFAHLKECAKEIGRAS